MCDELENMLKKEKCKKFIDSKSFIKSLAVFRNKIYKHILNCTNCQPERLNEKTAEADAIV
jgi:hypothetical protein